MKNKRCIFAIAIALSTVFVGCKSKEEKAAELIKQELSKTLYDFDSYQPIETIVTEAKSTAYNDTACWKCAIKLSASVSVALDYLDKAKDAREYMDIFTPSYYSSSYSNSKYYEYSGEYDAAIAKANRAMEFCNEYARDLKKLMEKLDTTEIIGWNVDHSFRCKTKGGSSAIAHYRYVVDRNFKAVLLREDMDDEKESNGARSAIENVKEGWKELTPLQL